MNKCEKCDVELDPQSYDLMDYCAECSKNLCGSCMKKGCCNNIPAKSGCEEDNCDLSK